MPVVLAVAIAVRLAWAGRGSIDAADWLGAALLVLLVLATALGSGAAVGPPRAVLLGVGALLALAAWTAASVAWAPVPALARDEALLVLAYAAALLLPAVLLVTRAQRLIAVGAIALGSGALATGAAVRLLERDALLFEFGRLEFPLSYANANAGLLLVGFWPAVALAAERGAPLVLRAAGGAAATAVLGGWLLAQSKGAGVALLVAGVLVLAASPSRLRLLVPAVGAVALAATGYGPLTEPYRAEDVAAAGASAGRVLLSLTAAGAAFGAAFALADAHVTVPARVRRGATIAVAAVAALAAAAGLAALAVRGDDLWRSFSTFHEEGDATTHLVTLGNSNRYDFWRVALRAARDEPLLGVGGRGFGALYLREGASPETPARAHSVVFDELAETGVPGLLLLVAAACAALAGALARARTGELAAAGGLGAGAVFLAHSLVDWTWSFPAVGLLAFLALGATAGGGTRLRPLAARAGAAAAALAALLLVAPPWLAARLTERVASTPTASSDDLDLARRLDPFSTEALVVAAARATTAAERVDLLAEAVDRAPESVAARYNLGIALLDAGRHADARRELRAALELDPGNELVVAALERAGPSAAEQPRQP